MNRISNLIFWGSIAVVFAHQGRAESDFNGQWHLDPELSSAVDPWRRIELDLKVDGERVTIQERLTTGRRHATHRSEIDLSKDSNEVPLGWWTGNRHIGAFAEAGAVARVSGEHLDAGRALRLESRFTLLTTQGEAPVREYCEYRISEDGQTLTRMTLRSTRPLPILHVFKRQ